MKKTIKLAIIGYGQRGKGLLTGILTTMAEMDIEIVGVCDFYEDRAKAAAEYVQDKLRTTPVCTTDYRELLQRKEIDAILIFSAWESHIQIAIDAMNAGKYVGMEVGGAYSLEDCWNLVRTYEKTGVPCMLLENCCYGRREMMALRMAEEGLFGEIVHCSGGYCHDLREEIVNGESLRHYRLRNYQKRNCENYPTHELGPIAKILKINHGNRFLSLASFASCAKGLNEYAARVKGADSPLARIPFAQGDIVTTVIRCAGGQSITLTLDTALPRPYSRAFTVRGTKGMYAEDTDSVFLDGVHNADDFHWKKQWGNAVKYEEQYDHPLLQEYKKNICGGHDGIDWLVFRAFIDSVKAGTEVPIDVYDAAAWMCISTLSENSIALGGIPVSVPDFTSGRWICS